MNKPAPAAAWTAELAQRWDEARSQLRAISEAAATAEAALGQLPADATAEQRQLAEKAVAATKSRVEAAQTAIAELAKGPKPPKGGKTPPVQAKQAAHAATTASGNAAALETLTISGDLFGEIVRLANAWDTNPIQVVAHAIGLAGTVSASRAAERDFAEAGEVEAIVVTPVRWKGKTYDAGRSINLPQAVFDQLLADGAVREGD